MKYRHENGFATLEVIITVITVAMVILIGSVVYRQIDGSNSALILKRQRSIDSSITSITSSNYALLATTLAQRGYITNSLYASTQSLISSYSSGNFSANPAYATMVCINEIPRSFQYGPVHISSGSNSATLPVDVYVPYVTKATSYTAYWLKINDTWQLNKVQCS